MHHYFIYILTNKSSTLYIGITNNLQRRLFEHKSKLVNGFTARYNLNKLIYFEEYTSITDALNREKQLKGWSRKKKMNLIKTLNPQFEEISI